MLSRLSGAAKELMKGRSLEYALCGVKARQPFGPDFGLTIYTDFVAPKEVKALRKGYVDEYTQKSGSMRLSDGRLQLPPLDPDSFMDLLERMERDEVVPKDYLNNQTANFYEAGDFIRAHVDNLFVYEDIFAVVSLGANAMMRFVHVQTGEELDTVIPENSVYILEGPARYIYFHMVLPVEAQRFSIVFRRSILNSDGGFRRVTGPLRDTLKVRSTALQNALYSKQVGGIRVKLDDDFLSRENIGPFDTAKWVKTLRPLRDWSLKSQLAEDEARLKELAEKRYIDADFGWRIRELQDKFALLEDQFCLKKTQP
jgi:alkylated DNA repair dioxygenase AlkB